MTYLEIKGDSDSWLVCLQRHLPDFEARYAETAENLQHSFRAEEQRPAGLSEDHTLWLGCTEGLSLLLSAPVWVA